MRICVMTGATHALDSCAKAIGRHRASSHLHVKSPPVIKFLQVDFKSPASHIFQKSVIFIYVTGAVLYLPACR